MGRLTVRELGPETWEDWLEVMGPRGGEAGCFCMFYRQTSSEYEANKGEPNRAMAKVLVDEGAMPGLIGYREGRPVGWVQVGPKALYPRLERSRVTKSIDERDAWSVSCFVIAKGFRRQGVAKALLEAAVVHARSHGAEVLEGYPLEPKSDQTPPIWAWMGFAAMFEGCGFEEVARRSSTRPFMRLEL